MTKTLFFALVAVVFVFHRSVYSENNNTVEDLSFIEVQAGGTQVAVDDDALTYRILQQIKGSFPSVGPLQCESVCKLKPPTPSCGRPVPECALKCPKKCKKFKPKASGFRYRVCVEGCAQFCAFAKDCCNEHR